MSVQLLDAYVICFGLSTSSTTRFQFAFCCSIPILILHLACYAQYIPFVCFPNFLRFVRCWLRHSARFIVLQLFFGFSLLAIVQLFGVAALAARIDNNHVQRISLWLTRCEYCATYTHTHCVCIKYFNRWIHKVFICRKHDDKRTISIPSCRTRTIWSNIANAHTSRYLN